MVEVKPFLAIIYNYEKVCQPRKVICPPYDIIPPLQARTYRRLSSYNMIHLTLPKDASGQNQYQKAARFFRSWFKKGIFSQDKKPAIYFYQQEFKINKGRFTPHLFSSSKDFIKDKAEGFKRLGFIACLSLDNSSSVYGHEHTRIGPKEDRFKLLVKVQANLEPIFVLFSDRRMFVQEIFKKYVLSNKPLIRLTEPAILEKIKARMKNKILFIADGHHRYEVSLNYREALRRRLGFGRHFSKNKDPNYIMTYFCPIQSSGLVIEPIHRLVKGIDSFPIDKFKKFFYIQKTSRRRLFCLLESCISKRRTIGAYVNKNFYIFILKNNQILNKIDKSYRSLDVCLLNRLVLKKLLRVKPDDKYRVVFSANAQDLIRQADMDKTSLVFFIKPVKISDVLCLAKAGKKMPVKTTYFYPKVPSGLVIYKFDN